MKQGPGFSSDDNEKGAACFWIILESIWKSDIIKTMKKQEINN